jgi:CHASE2 domain-containing sensor protein/tRNA A-37 threonylcarbamoyl transferase component Bud32
MAEESTSTLTKKYISATNRWSNKVTRATSTQSARQSKQMARLGNILAGLSVVGAAILTGSDLNLTQLMESQMQTVFYQVRGTVSPPPGIVILAIDEDSISVPKQYYQVDPQQYAYLEPLQTFPFKRGAYAQVIDKLISAGVRSVGLDIVFSTENLEGSTEDEKLRSSLLRYGNKVALAAQYENFETRYGVTWQLAQPLEKFRLAGVSIGAVNFPLEVDGKIHRFASEFPKSLTDIETLPKIPTFDQAVLRAGGVNYPRPKGDRIHFYGRNGTFEQYSFWHVLDPENWNTYLQQGKIFKDKIVLIGATDKLNNDYHPVAAGWLYSERMSGVEIHANAIATLMQGKAIAVALPLREWRGLFVLALLSVSAVIITRTRRSINRFLFSIGLLITWGGISFILFVYAQLIVPTAIPILAIGAIGLSYLGCDIAREQSRKLQLVDILKKNASSRLAQEILSQQDDLKDLLQQRELEIYGTILDGRYKIVKVLGSGGFSETYIAVDTKRPGNPECVVKQLKPTNNKSEQLAEARRLFNSEAQTLEKLGTHPQIPQLLAYFEEEEEFYLVQERIVGHPLNQELPVGKRLPETAVVQILQDLLQTLAFVHKNNVIHRDIKPSNIIRRHSDYKLVLIDFGAVKEVTTQMLDSEEQSAFTIAIGTKGYAPSEQCFGRPQYSSDIYAVGMIGIKALTGMLPHEIERDNYGQLKWIDKAQVTSGLAEILTKMVLDNYQERYQSASIALVALNQFIETQGYLLTKDSADNTLSFDNSDNPTTPWIRPEDDIPSKRE